MNKEIILAADELFIKGTEVRAGTLTAMYEGGRLRYLKAGNTEVIRMIYSALRDENWATIPFTIRDEKISLQDESFVISYAAYFDSGNIQYKAFYTIEGSADGNIVFTMRGESLSAFKSKRIGLCILQPISTSSGQTAEVRQPDGTHYKGVFPKLISPHTPFLNIKGMRWTTPDNTVVQIDFEGDIFETEDQRNWTDNSYKTYSTPSYLPSPVDIHPGHITQQSVRVHSDMAGTVEEHDRIPKKASEVKIPFPKIGYTRNKDQKQIHDDVLSLFKKIPFDHYRVELELNKEEWKKILASATAEAKKLNTRLELVVFFSALNDKELDDLSGSIKPIKDLVSSILILSVHHPTAPKDFFARAYSFIKNSFSHIAVGYGTNDYFVDINTSRPDGLQYDFTGFHLQPQVHTNDNRSIIENVGSYADLIQSLNTITGGKPIHVSPITINERYVADHRQYTWFAAWWTLLVIQHLGEVQSLTFYELTGNRGLAVGTNTSPVYKVLEMIKNFSPLFIIKDLEDDDVLLPGKLVLENHNGDRLTFRSKLPAPTSTQ